MRTQPATRSSTQPLGGTRADWRYRLLRYHLPLALASAAAIFLWMSLPLFRQPAGTAAAQHGAPQASGQAAQASAQHRAEQAAGQQMQMTPQVAPPAQAAPAAQAAGHPMPAQAAGHLPPQAAQAVGASAPTEQSRDGTGTLDGMVPLLQNRGALGRLSTATGYIALGLLAFTLLIGPANLLLRRRNPVSSYLRRDVGVWTAIVSVVHVVLGLQTHGNAAAPFDKRILRYFFAPDGSPLLDTFGLGNWTGLAATVIVVGLLAISSNFALRQLKAGPWKWLQRLNYALFALVVAHALYYAAFGGSLLRVTAPSTLLLIPSVIAVLVAQAVGVWLWRRPSSARRWFSLTPAPVAADNATF